MITQYWKMQQGNFKQKNQLIFESNINRHALLE